jgi:cell division protein FtsB
MVIGTRQRRRIKQVLGPFLAAAVVGYFAYYTVEGERGLIALTRLQAEDAQAEASLAYLQTQRKSLELKVTSLRSESLDLDRLDERTRALLNDSRPDELIITLPAPETGKR